MVGYDLPLNAVSETHEPKKMDDLVNGTREKAGMKIIRLDVHSLRQIFTALKKNEIVTILFDKPEPEQGRAGAVLRRNSLLACRARRYRPQDEDDAVWSATA